MGQEMDRSTYIGGSDIGGILGLSNYTTPLKIYRKKKGLLREEITEAQDKLFGRGRRWEPIILEMTVDKLREDGIFAGNIRLNNRTRHHSIDYFGAEIDMEIVIDDEIVNFEAKSVKPEVFRAWPEGQPPLSYVAQVMWGLYVTGRQRACLAAMTGFDDAPALFWVNRDDETVEMMVAAAHKFWGDYTNDREPAPICADDIKIKWPRNTLDMIDATDEQALMIDQLRQKKIERKNLDEDIDALESLIKMGIGEHEGLAIGGRPAVTWRQAKPTKKIDWEKTVRGLADSLGFRVDEAVAAHTKHVDGSRRFILK